MFRASHKNLESKTFGEWYEEGEIFQRTRLGIVERRGGREGVPASGPAGGCQAKVHAGILSVSGVSIYSCVASFC